MKAGGTEEEYVRSKRMFAVAAVLTTLSLAGTACAAPEDEGESSDKKTSLNLGWNQPFYSYNENTSNGNATANANIKYLMNEQFVFYNAEAELQENKSFGTMEKVSDDPLTVKYTVNDDSKWSDGTPVDAADMLLVWAGQSGQLNTIKADQVKTDEATGLPKNTKDKVYFDSSSPGLELVTKTPEIGDDGKSLTLVYDKPFADWQVDMTGLGVPAHITTEKALGISDPQEAKDAFIKAVQEKDNAALVKISSFWNTGFDYTKMPEDKDLALSNGAYVMKDFKENEYMTLEKNPDFKGDHQAVIDTLTVRWNEDPMAQVQALQNGEIDMLAPQVTTDVIKAAEKVENVEIETGVEGTYEHFDLVMNNKGPFDPAKYGGDKAKALKVRQAFLAGVPRQEIVDKLIKPIDPEAEVRNSFLRTAGVPGYDELIAQNGSSEYAEVDPAKSMQLLKEAGVKTPVDVRVMYAEGNVRRENEFQIYKPALAKAGFNLIDKKSAEWGDKLGDGTYDAVFFGWQSTSTGVSSDQAIFGTGGLNNLIGYSNPEVDKLFDELIVTLDEAKQLELQTSIEKILYQDAVGITIFQFPTANISNKTRVTNLDPAVLAPTMFYGFWDWEVPGN
jgi:peptide/nickel transport system substrate-binding protein